MTGGRASADQWRTIDWPAHRRPVSVGGRHVNLVELGSGDTPCLFLHGTGGCWQHWLRNLPALSRTRRVYAVDLPGFGASEMPAKRISIGAYADFVFELCAELGLEQVDLVGHSLGGIVAIEAARRRPDRIRRLILVGGTAFGILRLAGSPLGESLRHPALAAVLVAEVVAGARPVPVALRHPIATRPRLRTAALWYVAHRPAVLPSDLVYELVCGVGRPAFLPAVLAHREHAATLDSSSPVEVPTLAIAGARDRIVPASEFDELRQRAMTLQTELIPGAAHLPMLEQPDRFNSRAQSFLDDYLHQAVADELVRGRHAPVRRRRPGALGAIVRRSLPRR